MGKIVKRSVQKALSIEGRNLISEKKPPYRLKREGQRVPGKEKLPPKPVKSPAAPKMLRQRGIAGTLKTKRGGPLGHADVGSGTNGEKK